MVSCACVCTAELAHGGPHLAQDHWALLQNADKRLKWHISPIFLQLPPNPSLNSICSFL